jgi:hypothetical protein
MLAVLGVWAAWSCCGWYSLPAPQPWPPATGCRVAAGLHGDGHTPSPLQELHGAQIVLHAGHVLLESRVAPVMCGHVPAPLYVARHRAAPQPLLRVERAAGLNVTTAGMLFCMLPCMQVEAYV